MMPLEEKFLNILPMAQLTTRLSMTNATASQARAMKLGTLAQSGATMQTAA